MTRITCISDLHGYFPKLSGGDLLIVAGDLTARHTPDEYAIFQHWLEKQDYRKKIFIAGNHDTMLEHVGTDTNLLLDQNCEYLCDSGTEFEGLKIWGMPWSLTFEGINPKCTAFTCTEEEMKSKVDLIPDDIDILISHGPPFGYYDRIPFEDGSCWHAGSHSLEKRMRDLKKLKAVIFGHIHENGGQYHQDIDWDDIYYVNASIVNEKYKHVNKPVEIEI